jgi:hypothetical protein
MKKRAVFTVLGILLCTLPTFGQNIWPGDVYLGADVSSSLVWRQSHIDPEVSGSGIQEDEYSATFSGYGGYFIRQGVEIGPDLILRFSRQSDDQGNETTERSARFGGHAGYFHYTGGKWVPFGKLISTYNLTSRIRNGNEYSAAGFSLIPTFGIDLFLTASVAVKAAAFFDFEYLWWRDEQETGRIDGETMNLNTGISLGLDIFL